MRAHSVTMLGTGFIAGLYAATLHGQRGRDRVGVVFSRDPERGRRFARQWDVPRHVTDLEEAVRDPDTDAVVIALPNDLHERAVEAAAGAGKAVLCTKPLGRDMGEARRMLEMVQRAGVFHGYLEDLVYTPKTLKAVHSVRQGAVGDVLWVRSRETHPGPHSAWFWSKERAGGGALIDMGCHCAEIARSFVGKENRPVEAMCWADTLVHPIEAEDHAIALIRFESGAMAQIEVSWAFRGGMDLRDEVAGTEGTILLNHWLRTGFEMFTSGSRHAYVAEKVEVDSGWLFPVGDEVHELGYVNMFTDMFDAMDAGRAPTESFYDGYVVNAMLDACYRSARTRRWETVELDLWHAGAPTPHVSRDAVRLGDQIVIKEETMPDGSVKRILRSTETGRITETVTGAP